MTRERWEQVERTYRGALECDPSGRAAFLDSACGDDSELHRQVQALLENSAESDSFLERPAMELVARSIAVEPPHVTAGQRLDTYELLSPIGAGGMGEVWRARDSALGREVAIKFLVGAYARDAERLRRFEQEARAAGALNHPNVLAVYTIGHERAMPYLVTELLDGETLRERLNSGKLPLRKAIACAAAVARGLAAAHEKGIAHRDIKPENIFLTRDGRVKILDFGLAKLKETARVGAATAPGIAMGTPGYMSPEQVRGEEADQRADLFALGAVFYEMLSGRRAFPGETAVDAMGAILRNDPPPLADVPPLVARIVEHCIEKNREERFQSARDLAFQLEAALETSGAQPAISVTTKLRRRWVAAGGLLLVAVGSWAFRELGRRGESPAAAVRLTQDSGLTTDPALSPDGKLVAYASDRAGEGNLDIWIQNVASGESNRLTTDPADEREPAFSPDGAHVAFRSERDGGGIYIVPTIGGEPRLLAREAHRPRFSPDGQSIAYHVGATDPRTGFDFQTYVIPATGGPPHPVGRRLSVASNPIWTPDGHHLVVMGWRIDRDDPADQKHRPRFLVDWWVLPATDPEAAPIATHVFESLRRSGFTVDSDFIQPPVPSAWVGDGVLFSAQRGDAGNVWQVPLSSRDWTVSAAPRQRTFGIGQEIGPSAAEVEGHLLLAFASVTSTVNIWSLAVDANRGTVHGEPRRLTSAAHDAQLALSGDGRIMVFASSRAGSKHIWFKDLENGNEGPITVAAGDQYGPVITPDGSAIAYLSESGNRRSAYLAPVNFTPAGRIQPATPELLCSDCQRLWDISADGRRLLQIEASELGTLAILERGTRRPRVWLRHPQYALARARFSPDNRWVSFVGLIGAGRTRIFVVPFRPDPAPKPEEWVPIVGDDSFYDKPIWSPDGALLYFTADHDGFRCLRAQRLDPASKRPIGSSLYVYHFHGARLSMMNISVVEHEIAVAPGKLLFHLGDLTGNIWLQ